MSTRIATFMEDFMPEDDNQPERFEKELLAHMVGFINSRVEGEIDVDVVESMCLVSMQNLIFFTRKHQDYGRANISGAGEQGLLHRLRDKISRLTTLHFGREPNFEGVEDSIKDIAIQGLMLQVVNKQLWPDVDRRWDIGFGEVK